MKKRQYPKNRKAAAKISCPDCGKIVSSMGIGAHRRLAHSCRIVREQIEPEETDQERDESRISRFTLLPSYLISDKYVRNQYYCLSCGGAVWVGGLFTIIHSKEYFLCRKCYFRLRQILGIRSHYYQIMDF